MRVCFGAWTGRTAQPKQGAPAELAEGAQSGQSARVAEPDTIDGLLSSRFVFHCRQAGVRLSDEQRAAIDVEVFHLTMPPHATDVAWAPPSLRAVYERSDGVALFCPDGASMDNLRTDYGLLLHAAGEVAAETQRLRDWLLSDLEDLADEVASSDLEAVRRRIASFVAIGTRCTGDAIVLDSSAVTSTGEHPVAILDHELLLESVWGEVENAYPDVMALLIALDRDPHSFLDDAWRYHAHDGRQYYVDSVDRAP